MQQKIFAIRDAKAEIYMQPFFRKTHGEAERDFGMLVNDDKSMISKFPDDYDLYYLGDYNDQDGSLTRLETPKHIIKAVNFIKQ